MNKRKILALAMALSMVAILAVGATLAYFTDVDSDKNVFTVGSVSIQQDEWMRPQASDGSFEARWVEFDSTGKVLMPAVGTAAWAERENNPMPDGYTKEAYGYNWNGYSVFDDALLKNVQDKFITVKNTGNNAAYVRTIVAVERPANLTDEECVWISSNADYEDKDNKVVSDSLGITAINGVDYDIYVYTYEKPVPAGATTVPSLRQIYLRQTTTQEDAAKFGEDGVTILAFSQAVQADGFADAATALKEGFGEATLTSVKTWAEEIDW